MWALNIKNMLLATLSAVLFIGGCHSQTYSDLEALGNNCPSRDKCEGYRNNLTYMDRSCECDFNCTAYMDCCIDALPRRNSRPQIRRPPPRTDVKCLHYGENDHTGVFVISKCSSSWTGSRKVKEKCISSIDDFSDPLVAAPVTDEYQKKTYRNLACAECNHANLASLKTFEVKLNCEGLQELPEEQIMGDLTYNQEFRLWGVDRLNRFGNGTEFIGCNIVFDVPGYLNNSVRFCRSNLISTCASDWNRPTVAELCSKYTAAVYSNTHGYRNPHCALCNHKTVDEVSCMRDITGRKRPMSFALLLDVNQSDGEEVGMRRIVTPECPSNNKYDPFFKKCRQLVCALPGHVIVNGRCVRS